MKLLFCVSLFCRTENGSDVKIKYQFFESIAVKKISTELCDPPYVDLTAVFIKRSINFGDAAVLGLKKELDFNQLNG